MHQNEQLVRAFYQAFKEKDYKTMQACYSDEATFSDPVFPLLNADQARAMWEMFCKTGRDLQIEFEGIQADGSTGSANWTARYTFSATGKRVVNHIQAGFQFENGKIIRHVDTFNFHHWARQALGFSGLLLGGLAFMKNKVRARARMNLDKFMRKT
jgi:ketosteroid isomerase-like protein